MKNEYYDNKDLKEFYLILYDVSRDREFKKYFQCEYDMDRYILKLHYSTKLYIIKDSREGDLSYER